MPTPADQCTHDTLQFGSGDFYLFCHECGGKWGRISQNFARLDPDEANRGAGSQLSGHKRVIQQHG